MVRVRRLGRQRQHRVAHGAIRRQARPGAGEGLSQIGLVEHDERLDVLGLAGDQGAGQLVL